VDCVSVGERRALFERGRTNAREETRERAARDHPAAGRAFKRDVVLDDEPLVASTNLLNEAEIAEKERLAEAPIAVREPLGEFGYASTFNEALPSERRIAGPAYPSVRLSDRQPGCDGIGGVASRASSAALRGDDFRHAPVLDKRPALAWRNVARPAECAIVICDKSMVEPVPLAWQI
jgi:hypothetical protein